MGKILQFDGYKKINMKPAADNGAEKFKDLLAKLEENKRKKYVYDKYEMEDFAGTINSIMKYSTEKGPVPVIDIAQEFGFLVYEKVMDPSVSAATYINGNTQDMFLHNRVIILNRIDEESHRRFALAHELAYFLVDFLSNIEYLRNDDAYIHEYRKDATETEIEKLANRFATALLMPGGHFVKQLKAANQHNADMEFVISYLAQFFNVSIRSIVKRLTEVVIE